MDRRRFLQTLESLKKEVQTFDRRGRKFLRSLPAMSEEAYEALTPQAELEGTLECLLGDDLEPALRKIRELESLLRQQPAPTSPGERALSGAERGELTAEERQALLDAAREAGAPDFGDVLCRLGELLGFEKVREDFAVVVAEVEEMDLPWFRSSDS